MTDTPRAPQPLTDGEIVDRIVTAIHHGFAQAATDTEFPNRVEAATVNVILAAVLPELDRLRDGLADRTTKVKLLQGQLAEALRILDAGPQPVNDHVVQHWSIPAMRAANVLRPAIRTPGES